MSEHEQDGSLVLDLDAKVRVLLIQQSHNERAFAERIHTDDDETGH